MHMSVTVRGLRRHRHHDIFHPACASACRTYEAEGHDLQSLLFNFLDELLFAFATEFFVAKQLRITTFDRDNWRIVAEGCARRHFYCCRCCLCRC